MAQQLGIVVIIDIEAALRSGTLKGCTYLFDNAAPFGSTGQGTDHLVSAIHGTYWSDGSQASQPILNFNVTGVTTLPITLPRNYAQHRASQEDEELLAAALRMAHEATNNEEEEVMATLGAIRPPQLSKVKLPSGDVVEHMLLDHFGQPIPLGATLDASVVAQLPPIITGISGEAVEKGIIFPAQYGSPDFVNGGWYWSATVATYSPKVWSYTLHILIYRLAHPAGLQPVWEPVRHTIDGYLNITTSPMRNGFTGGGVGLLPVGLPW